MPLHGSLALHTLELGKTKEGPGGSLPERVCHTTPHFLHRQYQFLNESGGAAGEQEGAESEQCACLHARMKAQIGSGHNTSCKLLTLYLEVDSKCFDQFYAIFFAVS